MPRRPLLFWLLLCALTARGETVSPKVLERYKQMLAANPVEGTALDRLWTAYSEMGQTAQLLHDYEAAGNFATALIHAHLLRKAGRSAEAIAAYERAAALDPKSALPLLAVGRLQLEEGAAEKSARSFERALTLAPPDDPRRGETLMQLGSAWLAAANVEKAAAAWEQTAALDPNNLELRRKLADTYAQNHLSDRAILHLEFLRKHAPPTERAAALQQLARIHQGAGRQDEAIRALEDALATTAPGHWLRAELQSQLIRLHQRFHRTAELEERWEKAAELNPRDLGSYLQLIDLYERTGDLEKQRAWLEKLTELVPKNVEYRIRQARLLMQLDQPDAAAKVYDALLKERPGNVDLVFERARIDVQLDAAPAARQRIATLLKSNPQDATLRGRALEFYESHRLREVAEEHLQTDAAADTDEAILALANFYFGQGRDADARATLRRLVRPAEAVELRAAAHFRIAQILKDQNEADAARESIQAAIALRPGMRDFHLLQGELDASQGRYREATPAFERAYALSANPVEAAEADQRLFETLRNGGLPRDGEISGRAAPALPFSDGKGPPPEVQDYVLKLTRAAADKPTIEAWLRVGRWHLWNRNLRVAQESARQALAIDPASIPTHEFLVKLGTAEPHSTLAIKHLQELMKLDPTGRAGYQRRAGQLELQNGHVEEALSIFKELAEANPGSVEALSDLALTQQRTEKWTDALATWQRIYAVTPAGRKREVSGALLRVYERLGMVQDAAALLLRELDARREEREQFSVLQDLLTHCNRHGLLGWLRTEFEQRRQLRADDYFTEMAFGRILKASGEKAAAFELIADASFAAPNQAAALPELVREAEELRKFDAAIRLQAQLVRMTPQPHSDGLEKLAQLQEKNLQIEAAVQTWEKIAIRFPRDTAALQHTVDFILKWGAPARAAELLRKIRALDPSNVRALAQLADLDIESRTLAEAQSCLEEILKRTPAEKPGDAIRYPALKKEDAGRLQTTYTTSMRQRRARPTAEAIRGLQSFWVDNDARAKNDAEPRLRAIRDLAQLIRDKGDAAELARWIARWKTAAATAPGEALWAFHYAGASDVLLDHAEALSTRKPGDAAGKQAFIWLALQTGEFARLSRWMQSRGRTSLDRDYFFFALAQHLQSEPAVPDPALLANLFPEGFRLRLWQAATLFGSRTQFREAAQLGQRVFEGITTQRAPFGVELAHWYLYLGEIENARRVLGQSLTTPGSSLEAPVYTALREAWLLLPADERPAFAEKFLRSLDRRAQPLHTALCGTILHGLAGNTEAARGELNRILQLRAISTLGEDELGNSTTRSWDFILSTGAQLQAWKLETLAGYFWESALADDALIRLQAQMQGEQVRARIAEVRTRLTALRVARAPEFEVPQIVDDFARRLPPDGLVALAEHLETMGANARGIEVLRRLWEAETSNPHALRNLLNACRTGGDLETLEQILTRCVKEGIFRGNDPAHRDLVLQLVESLETRGDAAQARLVLDQEIGRAPNDSRLLVRLAQLHQRAGRLDVAESVFSRALAIEPGNLSARVAFATVLEAANKAQAAIELLEKTSGTEPDARLAQLFLQAGRIDDALAVLERIPAPNYISLTLQLAQLLADRGDAGQARALLRQVLSRNANARTKFPLQTKLIELLAPEENNAVIAREASRLRRMAGDDLELQAGYFEFALRQAPRLGWEKDFLRELAVEWDNGAGSAFAGATLLEWKLAHGEVAETDALTAKLLAHEDASEALLRKVAAVLETAKRSDLSVQARERLARLNPRDDTRMTDWARALHALGRKAEATKVLDELGARSFLNDEINGRVAQAFAEIGQPQRARVYFEAALAADPGARNFRVPMDYAKLLIAEKDFTEAKRALRRAFRNPANREGAEVVAFLAASGGIDRADRELAELRLDAAQGLAARRALLAHYEKNADISRALALWSEHPEIAQPGLGARIRKLAGTAERFEEAAAFWERLRTQQTSGSEGITGELAALYADWAENDLRGLQTDAAVAHLQRAQKLQPADFAVAKRLSELHLERGERPAATRTLEDFLAASRNAAEKDQARQLLSRLKAA